MRSRQVARTQHHVIARGRSQLIFFLLGVQRLLRQGSRLFRRRNLRTVLLQSNERVPYVNHDRVFGLPVLHGLLPLVELRPGAIRLCRAVPNRQREIQPDSVRGELILKHILQRVAQPSVTNRRSRQRHAGKRRNPAYGNDVAVSIHQGRAGIRNECIPDLRGRQLISV